MNGPVYREDLGAHTRIEHRVLSTLWQGQSEFQRIDLMELASYGRTLFLDGVIQVAEADEFLYHESLIHPALLAHPAPKRILVAGGGDGGAMREVLKHPTVERVVLAELDPAVVEVCDRCMPRLSRGAFRDPRVEIRYGDARNEIGPGKEPYDVIVLDLTEPHDSGSSQMLYTREFYAKAKETLTEKGLLVTQAGDVSPGKGMFLADVCATLRELAPHVSTFTCPVPSFLGIWGFAVAGWHAEPRTASLDGWSRQTGEWKGKFNYLTAGVLAGGFDAPPYLDGILAKGQVRTEASPLVWSA